MSRRGFIAATAAAVLAARTAPAADFAAFIADLRNDALSQGISRATLDLALSNLQPIGRILDLEKQQPERKVGFTEYLRRAVNDDRVRVGRQRLAENAALLGPIGEEFGVAPAVVVALWGMETDYGRFIGGFPVIGALATLAYDGRRTFFRRELVHALRVLDQGHVALADMKGSWAGAMGQAQFLPSSFLAYAVDRDGDGRKDIWNATGDVLASIANYLKQVGWRPGMNWGQAVKLPADFAGELASLDVTRTVGEWRRLGVVAEGASPAADLQASVVRPGGAQGPAYVVTENYRVFMRWNKSQYFATATGVLADRLARA